MRVGTPVKVALAAFLGVSAAFACGGLYLRHAIKSQVHETVQAGADEVRAKVRALQDAERRAKEGAVRRLETMREKARTFKEGLKEKASDKLDALRGGKDPNDGE